MPPWLVLRGKIFKIINNSKQLAPTFLSKYWQKHDNTALTCSNSIFNIVKKVTGGSFLFLCKTVFLFLPVLNLGTQIRCPQNWYSNLNLVLDQPLVMWPDLLHIIRSISQGHFQMVIIIKNKFIYKFWIE